MDVVLKPPTTPYDGCGMCFVATRRLSRTTETTSSPERQAEQIIAAVAKVGGHIIDWADDFKVSGASDPMTRKGLGPWLRNQKGPYNGLAAASVDRAGRNVRDVLNSQALLTEQDRMIVTADHEGIWDFSNVSDENEWMIKAWGSQMELRSIQKRNRDETDRARKAGMPKQRPSYGYMYIRLHPGGKIDHVEIDPVAYAVLSSVVERLLADQTGKITVHTEAVRLTRAGVPSPEDRRAQLYGRELKGLQWWGPVLHRMLLSEAALGFLMHNGRPVVGNDGHPVRIAPELWSRAVRDALVKKLAHKHSPIRAPKAERLLSTLGDCGNCGGRLYLGGALPGRYGCTGRIRGILASQNCKPAPNMKVDDLDAAVTEWFLTRYGGLENMRQVYDPGTGYAGRITALQEDRARLRDDRAAGLYNDAEGAAYFRTNYARMTKEMEELQGLPDRAPSMQMVPTGVTVAQEWEQADTVGRREILGRYGVRVTLYPRAAKATNPRYKITSSMDAGLFNVAV